MLCCMLCFALCFACGCFVCSVDGVCSFTSKSYFHASPHCTSRENHSTLLPPGTRKLAVAPLLSVLVSDLCVHLLPHILFLHTAHYVYKDVTDCVLLLQCLTVLQETTPARPCPAAQHRHPCPRQPLFRTCEKVGIQVRLGGLKRPQTLAQAPASPLTACTNAIPTTQHRLYSAACHPAAFLCVLITTLCLFPVFMTY